MTTDFSKEDDALRHRLEQASGTDDEFWSFRHNAKRYHSHAFSQYPAMMVPQMQGEILRAIAEVSPGRKSVLDPFVGSGTVLTEVMTLGWDFTGIDINPLAVLLCRAKSGQFDVQQLLDEARKTLKRLDTDSSTNIEVDFPGLQKWFRQDVAIGLSQIRRAIKQVQALWVRRFLWVALAETCRLSSNSRTSTYKLHTRPADEITARAVDAKALFCDIVRRNCESFAEKACLLEQYGHLDDQVYSGTVSIELGSATDESLACSLHDVLVTSPPYGDNRTTVPYGQFAFLPLQWIPLEDIDPKATRQVIANTYALDTLSLGGRISGGRSQIDFLSDASASFKVIMDKLNTEPRDRRDRVASFCWDLHCCIAPVLDRLKSGAVMVWTVGNRRVGGYQIPIDSILSEFLLSHQATPIVALDRIIPSKRMATKNQTADTMRAEITLVMRKNLTND